MSASSTSDADKTEQDPRENRSSGRPARWITAHVGIQLAVKLVRGLVIPKLLTPTLYGLFTSLNVVLRYGRFSDLGMTQLMSKQLPAIRAREGEEAFRVALRQSFLWILVSTGLVVLGIAAAAFFQDGEHAWFYRFGFPLIGGAIFVMRFRELTTAAVRARESFRDVALIGILASLLGLALAILLLILGGVLGLVTSLVLTEIGVFAFALRRLGWPGLGRIPVRKVKSMLAGGLSLVILSSSELLLATVDQLFILGFYEKADFGFYSLGLFISTTALSVSGIFLTIIHPKLMRMIEQKDQKGAHALMNQTLLAYFALLLVAIPVGYAVLYPFINLYLPDYVAGLSLYYLLAGLAFVRGPLLLFQPYFIARDEEKPFIMRYLVVIGVAVLLNAWVIAIDGSVQAIVLVSVLSYGALNVVLFWKFEQHRQESVSLSKYILLGLGLSCVAGFWGWMQFGVASSDESVMRTTLELVAGAGVCLFLFGGVFFVIRRRLAQSFRQFW